MPSKKAPSPTPSRNPACRTRVPRTVSLPRRSAVSSIACKGRRVAAVESAAFARLGRIVRCQALAEIAVGLGIPDACRALAQHVAECARRHGAGHGLSGDTDVGAAPWALAALPRLERWQAQADAKRLRQGARLGKHTLAR